MTAVGCWHGPQPDGTACPPSGAVPTPTRTATLITAAHSEQAPPRTSEIIRTAHSRSSTGASSTYLLTCPQPFHETESPGVPGRFILRRVEPGAEGCARLTRMTDARSFLPDEAGSLLPPASAPTKSLEGFVRFVMAEAGEEVESLADETIRQVAQAIDLDLRLTMIDQLPEVVRPRLAHLLLDADLRAFAWRTIVDEFVPSEPAVIESRMGELRDLITFGMTTDPFVMQVLVSRSSAANDAFMFETQGKGNRLWASGGPLDEALREAFLCWISTKAMVPADRVSGRTYLKVTSNGGCFLTTLNPDGSILERAAQDVDVTWGGEWQIALDCTGDDPSRGVVVLSVGEYNSLLFHSATDGTLAGPEHFQQGDRPHAFAWLAPLETPIREWLTGKVDDGSIDSIVMLVSHLS